MDVTDRLFASPEASAALKVLTDALAARVPAAAKGAGRYNRMVDAMNRLPRPLLALGSLLLVAYAMLDPAGFSQRMTALAGMPDALWWLIGAIITFTFGARETHYLRGTSGPRTAETPAEMPATTPESEPNAALDDWQSTRP